VELLKEGLIKRVGNGASTNIWHDPWVVREGNPYVISPKHNNLVDQVADLINPVSGDWDKELVRDCLWTADVVHVLQMPVRGNLDDCWAWRLNQKGIFSVKSAYWLHRTLLDDKGCSSGVQQAPEAGSFCRNDIWSCPCPPNVRQFLWRIAHDSIPHRCNIARKGIDIDPLCLVCGRLNEDGAHLFLKCKGVKQIWRNMGLEETRHALLLGEGPKGMLTQVFKLEQSKKITCIAVLWEWWKHRNKINAENAKLSCEGVTLQVKRCVQEYGQFCVPRPQA
jgi:hypothetical protein